MMRSTFAAAALSVGALSLFACSGAPVQRVDVPPPTDQNAYQPQPMPKALPPEGYDPTMQQAPPPPGQPAYGQPMPPPPPGPGASAQPMAAPYSIRNEDTFVQAYESHRSPRIMIFVNRTIQGDPLPKDNLEELIRVEEKQSATGAVNVSSNNNVTGNGQSTNSTYGGSSASNVNINKNNGTSFSSNGPADYTKTTSVKVAPDKIDAIGASSSDYDLIEASIVKYFDNSGKVTVQDAEAARGKLDREKILRIENGDPAANRLLATELQQDILVRVTATPTSQSSFGQAVRLNAKAVSITDGRMLAVAFADMPLPLSKTNINVATRYLSEQLMGDMARKWAANPSSDTIEVRVYKTATVDDALKIRKWLQRTPGVTKVINRGATGGSSTAYAAFAVSYAGAPEDLYAGLQDEIGQSQGMKAVDLQNNTVTLEVTGQLNLVTTTQKSDITTTTTVHTTEEKKIEPINSAPSQ